MYQGYLLDRHRQLSTNLHHQVVWWFGEQRSFEVGKQKVSFIHHSIDVKIEELMTEEGVTVSGGLTLVAGWPHLPPGYSPG